MPVVYLQHQAKFLETCNSWKCSRSLVSLWFDVPGVAKCCLHTTNTSIPQLLLLAGVAGRRSLPHSQGRERRARCSLPGYSKCSSCLPFFLPLYRHKPLPPLFTSGRFASSFLDFVASSGMRQGVATSY